MSTASLSPDCVILTAWQPTRYRGGCCVPSSNCNSAGNVQRVELSSNQLQGIIPTEFGLLTSLTWLSLWGNQLTGTIPTELGRLTRLQYVDLYNNQFTGTIPTELGQLTSLTWLALYNNQLSGTIPTELGRLASVTWLSLNGNQLSGTIPTELGQLTGLTNLELNVNRLTGTIPTELGRLTRLQFFRLNANNLSGKFPCELGNLRSLTVTNFAGNSLESTNFNTAQLSQSCASTLIAPAATASSTTTVAASNPGITTVTSFNPSVTFLDTVTTLTSFNPSLPSLKSVTTVTSFIPSVDDKSPTDQQQTSAPIIGGVAGAAFFVCLIVTGCIWFRRRSVKKESPPRASAMNEEEATFGTAVEIVEPFVPASIPPPPATIYASDKKAAVGAALGDFLVASKIAAPPEKVGLFDGLGELSHDRKHDRNFDAPSKGPAPDSKVGIVSKPSGGVSDEGQPSAWISATGLPLKKFPINQPSESQPVAFAVSNDINSSSSHHIALPMNPKDWSKDEVGQWMLEKFEDAELSSLALSQRINGRVLLMLERPDIVSWLKIDTVGQILLLEEAIAELRRQSAQQSALAQENPPSYE